MAYIPQVQVSRSRRFSCTVVIIIITALVLLSLLLIGGSTWTLTLAQTGLQWASIASSNSGAQLAAVVYDGGIHTSVVLVPPSQSPTTFPIPVTTLAPIGNNNN